ncbi:hypothetical protein GOBAR_DD09075 [Gossypium barbadense]|nr:hypothetical protein GOBAR_DD09075 [Gossypium barbadense]
MKPLAISQLNQRKNKYQQKVINEFKTRERISEKTMEVPAGVAVALPKVFEPVEEPLEENRTPFNVPILPIIFLQNRVVMVNDEAPNKAPKKSWVLRRRKNREKYVFSTSRFRET